MSSIVRRSTSLIAAAAILLGIGAAAGCTRESDTCSDVAAKICSRVDQCQALDRYFVSRQQCLDSFMAMFTVAGSDDVQCRDQWNMSNNLECRAFLDYYSL